MSPTARDIGRSREPMSSSSRANLSNRMAIIWQRGKVKVNRLLGNVPPDTRIVHESTHIFPYEIMGMIIAHLTYDFDALKACSLTCRSWYIAVVSHIHHTLILRERTPKKSHDKLKTLSKLHERGLMPLVEEIRVYARYRQNPWFVPRAFGNRNLRHFSAFTNVRTLKICEMEIYRFIPGIERYFGHFSHTLQSIALWNPRCTPRQLSYFLSLFSNLDDIEIKGVDTNVPGTTAPDTTLFPISTPKLRGRLTLHYFYCPETWTGLINSCGGLRFRYMDLHEVVDCTPILLEVCAETVETIRLHVPCVLHNSYEGYSLPSPLQLDLSQLEVLRSLQIVGWTIDFESNDARRYTILMKIFLTITSPVFSEVVIVLREYEIASLPSQVVLFQALRTMNKVKPFKLAFLVEISGFYPEERQELAGALDSVIAKGLLDFLESPPSILTSV